MTQTMTPAIAILPSATLLVGSWPEIACDTLEWPLGQPERLRGKRLRDMERTDHLIAYPRNDMHIRPFLKLKARLSIMVQEPRTIHGHHRRALRVTWRKFFRVFSHDRSFVDSIPNGVFVPFGTTWVPGWRDVPTEKTKDCSIIASAKRSQVGHNLRHRIIERVRTEGLDVDAMGGGYVPFAEKSDGLAPYRYSVVIENVREPNYFSEKLIDPLLCLTVPIYWGCPNIADYLDTGAMIICESEADIMAALSRMSQADYAARLPALRALRPVAASYDNLHNRTISALLASL